MAAPIERLASVEIEPGTGQCTGCGKPDVNDLCAGCFNARWTAPCALCGGDIVGPLARLGSFRCQDCRDGMGQLNDYLRRAA